MIIPRENRGWKIEGGFNYQEWESNHQGKQLTPRKGQQHLTSHYKISIYLIFNAYSGPLKIILWQ